MPDTDMPGLPYSAGTPSDYSPDLYQVYFEIEEFENNAKKVFCKILGSDASRTMIKLHHGYEVQLPIQSVPDIIRELALANIAVYQVIRHARVNGNQQIR